VIIKNTSVKEELFVPLARYLRYRRVIGHLPRKTKVSMVDFGCDPEFSFFTYCKEKGVDVKKYMAVDPLLDDKILRKHKNSKNITLVKDRVPLKKKGLLKSGSAA